ncbi:reticulophagy regulator 3-like [Asterias rubens]|uniref:reticulophagy regulator 3-like n=1 Tax=Asterias rubens TaxID=7604 RepID=UPI0014554EDB|nr:reticulophagy regulator 3-like [Asterias rubens]
MDEELEEKAKTTVKKYISDSEMKAFERETEVRLREKKLREFLSPFESFIMSVQSLLVWEKPVRSAVMVLCVNGLLWMAVATNYRIIFVAAVSGIVFVSMETICTRVWPEIRVQKPDEDEEGWTPVHPHLQSLPELCEHIAKLWVTLDRLNIKLWGFRQDYPSKFCLYVCGLCLTLAAIGHQISGTLISFIIVTGLLLWPALEYHNISGRLYQRIEPILQQLDHSIDSPRREKKLGSQQRSARARANSSDNIDSSSDSDLDEFCPSPGPSVDAALAHAATAGRYTPRSSGIFSGLSNMSKGMSLDLNTDDEFTDTEPASYMGGLSQVPSFDNTAFDQSADELEIDLPYDNEPPAPSKSSVEEENLTPESSESIKFDPTHFRESSEIDNEELLVGDLEFPDVEGSSSGQSLEADKPSPVSLPPAAAMLLSHTVKSLMTDALTKLQEFGSQDDVSSASEPSQESQQQQRQASHYASGTKSAKRPKLVTMDSDSAEFEILDREELEEGKVSGEEKKDEGKTRSKSGYGIGFLTSWLSGKKE